MILILSQEFESSTNHVIDWIHHLEGEFIRINCSDFFDKEKMVNLSINDDRPKFDSGFDLSEIRVVWFRRWHDLEKILSSIDCSNNYHTVNQLKESIKYEVRTFWNYVFTLLKELRWLTKPEQTSINKLYALQSAKEVGLKIPETIISNNINSLCKNKKYITKPLFEGGLFTLNNISWSNFTSLIDVEELKDKNLFPLSLFQEYQEKDFEIRTFYLMGKCYSMAIFSQESEQTKVDFRDYDHISPNRNVPFKLSEKIEEKIDLFMKKVNLETGSLDFIRKINGDIVFLEVNPVGQFGMVSYPCNYFIEKDIALELIQNDNKL
jgi:ATP-GRASP peptide maturase of grasp-with-spasm system